MSKIMERIIVLLISISQLFKEINKFLRAFEVFVPVEGKLM